LDFGRGQSAAGLGLDPRANQVDGMFKVDQGQMWQAVPRTMGEHFESHRQEGQLVSRGAGENFQQFEELFYFLVFDEQIVARKNRKFDQELLLLLDSQTQIQPHFRPHQRHLRPQVAHFFRTALEGLPHRAGNVQIQQALPENLRIFVGPFAHERPLPQFPARRFARTQVVENYGARTFFQLE